MPAARGQEGQAAPPTPDCHSFPARQLLATATGAVRQLETQGPRRPGQAEREGRAERKAPLARRGQHLRHQAGAMLFRAEHPRAQAASQHPAPTLQGKAPGRGAVWHQGCIDRNATLVLGSKWPLSGSSQPAPVQRERWSSHQLPGTAEMRAEAKAEAPVGGGSRHHTAQLPRRER